MKRNKSVSRRGLGCSIVLATLLIALFSVLFLGGLRLVALVDSPPGIVLSAPQEDNSGAERQVAQLEQARAQLNSYGWIDKAEGIARVPIERAMTLIAEQGLLVDTMEETAGEPPVTDATEPAVNLDRVNFEVDVLPILREHCTECHGSEDPEEDLQLTSHGSVMYGSINGPVVVPGDPENSFLVEQIASGQMPKRRDPLAQHEIDVIVAWIDQGALNEEPPATAPAIPQAEIDLTNVSFETDVLPILREHCTECHGNQDPEEDLQLTSYGAVMYGSLNGSVIEPGDPENSFLIEQIVSGQMPKRRDPLAQNEIDIITAWVQAGAPDN